jgi:TonB family protein
MASPAKIEQVLPDTLPEDFGGWDSEDSPAAPPARSGSFQPAPGISAVPKQPAQPAQPARPQAAVTRKAVVPTNAASQIRLNNAVADGRNPASLKAAAMREADEVLFQSIRSNRASMGRQKPTSKKWMMVATVPFGLILVMFVLTTLFYRGWLPISRHTVDTNPVAADTQPETSTLKPSPSTQVTSDRQPAAIDMQQTTDTRPDTDNKDVVLPQVQSKMMHDQLTAPTRIPHDLKQKATNDAPFSLNIGAAGLAGQGGNSAIGKIFNKQEQTSVNVAPSKTVAVSAGVAGGLLVQRTAPVYPQIAKSAHVSGTVVLKATISKTGIIKNLHVVSGPAMLTQSALDAVKTWRYKPYKLNGDPVEIETTVNVLFILGG